VKLLDNSGVAMVGADGHVPTLPWPGWVGREICTNSKFFWKSRVGRDSMSLEVHRIPSMNTSLKCVCPLQIVYA